MLSEPDDYTTQGSACIAGAGGRRAEGQKQNSMSLEAFSPMGGGPFLYFPENIIHSAQVKKRPLFTIGAWEPGEDAIISKQRIHLVQSPP